MKHTEMKTKEQILQKIADKINEGYGNPTYLARYSNMKYEAVDVLEAMEEYAQQLPSKQRIWSDEFIEDIIHKYSLHKLATDQEIKQLTRTVKNLMLFASELSADADVRNEAKPLRYFKCPKCDYKFEFDGFPYWRPIAEGHQVKKGEKLCTEKFIEITKEEYEKL